MPTTDTIPDLLKTNIPRGLLLAVEEALTIGANRAYAAARGMDEGHLPSVVGHLRHFNMNETFQRALAANDASPTRLKGNSIVTGRTGVFRVARFNIRGTIWNNGRRSQARRELALFNSAIEPLVQPDLFKDYVPPSQAVVFFVACFANSLRIQPEAPLSIRIAVPDRHMRRWLFVEPLEAFIQRYELATAIQEDLARPQLKKNIGKKLHKDGTAQ